MTETNLDVRIPALLSCEPGNPELENLKKNPYMLNFSDQLSAEFFFICKIKE